MPFDAKVYKVMIASPSDVEQERLAATDTIHNWTDDNSEEKGIVLLPIRWEKHSAPELSDTAQEIINKNLVAKSDILIALFWTRLGSPTGKEESGTVEEIMKFHQSGKLVMVYLCLRDIPRKHDAEQLKKLDEFIAKVKDLGIYHTYKDIHSLREDLRQHLTIQMRRIKEERRTILPTIDQQNVQRPPDREIELRFGSGAIQRKESARAGDVITQIAEANARREHLKKIATQERTEFEHSVLENKFEGFQCKRGTLALSILPIVPTRNRIEFSSKSDGQLLEMLQPWRASHGGRLERFRKYVIVGYPYPPGNPVSIITKLTDTGSLFSVACWFDSDTNDDQTINWNPYRVWQPVLNDMRRYLGTFKALNLPSPWTIGISLLKMKDSFAIPAAEYTSSVSQRLRINDEDNIRFDSVSVDKHIDVTTTEPIRELLEPIYKDIWLQYGYATTPRFDDKGIFIGMTPIQN